MWKNDIFRGCFYAFTGFLLFSLGDAGAKYLSASLTVPYILFWTQIFALLALLIVGAVSHKSLKIMIRTDKPGLHIIRGILLGSQVFLTFTAFSLLPLAQAYTFIFTSPLFATLISSIWLKERTSPQGWFVLFIGFSGILVILRPGFNAIEMGHIAALSAGLIFALGYIIGRRIGSEPSPYTFAFYPIISCIVLVTLYLGFTDGSFALPAPSQTGMTIFMGIASVGGILLLSWAYNIAPVPAVSSFHYTQILWGALLGYTFFGDHLDLWTVLGGTLIIASGLKLNRLAGQGQLAAGRAT